jgi:hypothetical protein
MTLRFHFNNLCDNNPDANTWVFRILNTLTGLTLFINMICIMIATWVLPRSVFMFICDVVTLVMFIIFVAFQCTMLINHIFFKKVYYAFIMFQFVIQEMIYLFLLSYIPLLNKMLSYFDYVFRLDVGVAILYWIIFFCAILLFVLTFFYFFKFVKTWGNFFEERLKKNEEEENDRKKNSHKKEETDKNEKDYRISNNETKIIQPINDQIKQQTTGTPNNSPSNNTLPNSIIIPVNVPPPQNNWDPNSVYPTFQDDLIKPTEYSGSAPNYNMLPQVPQ